MEGKGVHGSGWVGLKGHFNPTHHGGWKKIQPNPHGLGWTHGLDKDRDKLARQIKRKGHSKLAIQNIVE